MEEVVNRSEVLPFSKIKQRAVLGHLVVNDRFFLQSRSLLNPDWFQETSASQIFRAKLNFYKKFKRVPSLIELKESSELVLEEPRVRDQNKNYLMLAIHETQNFQLDSVAAELTSWMRARVYHRDVERSSKLFNDGQFEASYSILKKAMREIDQSSFENDDEVMFDNYENDFREQEIVKENAITTGLTMFDRLLLPDSTRGALLPGDSTLFLAPVNVGKTSTLITIVRHNILLRKPTLFLTHEGTREDIRQKLWCSLLDKPRHEVLKMYKLPEGRRIMDRYLQYMKHYLTYIPVNRPGMTVEDVESVIRRRQDERIAKTGKGYELLVDDYPAKLTCKEAAGGFMQKRHVDERVYDNFVQMALEMKFHFVGAIQTNRDGSRVNAGQREDRLLTVEDVHESFGPMQTATNVISINRDPAAEARNRVTYYVCKSRSSEKGYAIVCRSNFANCITHSDKLGSVYYKGTSTMADKIDGLLEQYGAQGGRIESNLPEE